MTAPTWTIVDAEVDAERVDVRLTGTAVEAIGADLPRRGTRVIEAHGGALLPGLHDHHLHLFALAARQRSIDAAGAPDDRAFDDLLRTAHRAARPGDWLRVVGVTERHGSLDVDRLERLAPGRPLRLQHRTGAAWMLSAAGARGVDAVPGEWLHRSDDELAAAWSDGAAVDLTATSRRLAALGVTGVTDATPYDDAGAFAALASARHCGELVQRVVVTGGPDLADTVAPDGLELGPVKVVVGDHDLPDPDDLAARFSAAHGAGRSVAVHCVSRVALVLVLVAWRAAGSVPGDRVEHGSVVPVELIADLAELGLTVVTQPGFVRDRGDDYLRDVEPDDRPHLYRCGSLLAAGVAVGMSTDAPFGPSDPWAVIGTAADRRTSSGAVLGADEAITVRRALDGFLAAPDAPGGPPRRISPGALADLVLLDRPLTAALADPSSEHVVTTWIGGDAITRD